MSLADACHLLAPVCLSVCLLAETRIKLDWRKVVLKFDRLFELKACLRSCFGSICSRLARANNLPRLPTVMRVDARSGLTLGKLAFGERANLIRLKPNGDDYRTCLHHIRSPLSSPLARCWAADKAVCFSL